MYLVRLDDASEHMDLDNWVRMKSLLDKYQIKPIYGIIPNNQDPELLKYEKVSDFWSLMKRWESEGWIPAMHGYTHVFETDKGGINPVNKRSEFAGVTFERQSEKIRDGYRILREHGIKTDIFFAPAHTFDGNTLKALYKETPIRVISDTISNDVYYRKPFYYIPQQSGRMRKLPFKVVTFCFHPNIMKNEDFADVEEFIIRNRKEFKLYMNPQIMRKKNITDKLLSILYFNLRKGVRLIDHIKHHYWRA